MAPLLANMIPTPAGAAIVVLPIIVMTSTVRSRMITCNDQNASE